jgi:hypothetical protein
MPTKILASFFMAGSPSVRPYSFREYPSLASMGEPPRRGKPDIKSYD